MGIAERKVEMLEEVDRCWVGWWMCVQWYREGCVSGDEGRQMRDRTGEVG